METALTTVLRELESRLAGRALRRRPASGRTPPDGQTEQEGPG
ncbi:hypothetical protein [Curtobacterium sp. MCPF17_003]|nr:hypothetical protein [Curtobacterium sp. MCPF17_003]